MARYHTEQPAERIIRTALRVRPQGRGVGVNDAGQMTTVPPQIFTTLGDGDGTRHVALTMIDYTADPNAVTAAGMVDI